MAMAAATKTPPRRTPTQRRPARVVAAGLLAAGRPARPPAAARADDWLRGEDATGTWGGARAALDDHGLHVDLDYTAETFTRDLKAIDYRGNLDLVVDYDTEEAGLWKGGQFLAFAQQNRGSGVSDEMDLAMPASNFETQGFAQLSELWLYQELPHGISLRIGKQDANRDFAAPRFPGNFTNSSYGVLPNTPLPSFPAPALGAALFLAANDSVSFRAGVYEGSPKVESFAGNAFDDGSGVFVVAAATFENDRKDDRNTRSQLGGWHHTALDRSGLFGIVDRLYRLSPSASGHQRGLQFFVRGSWDPQAHGSDADLHLGGGVTAHGFTGENNTVGLGSGYVSIADRDQTFVELFFKWRPIPWFTVQPDAQVHFVGSDAHFVFGLRCKVKL